ncbi:MAG: hypothetical protein HYZ93_06650 [Candidatus Omnitrophica bacterium]|nr:hypothetical protein [Candidatus Omnitrophota bacterium]
MCYPSVMIQLLEPAFLIEEEEPALDIAMPRVYRRPAAPPLTRGNGSVSRLVAEARRAHEALDRPALGKAYGELAVQFQPGIDWAFSCWEFLLSTEGCRFLPRSADEKRYCRGDYRVFTENDFRKSVYRAFKGCLLSYLEAPLSSPFEWYLRQTFWLTILKSYRALEEPQDPNQRRLTPYSYLRCSPYQFLNGYHQERVYQAVGQLPALEQQVVELYTLRFYREEAAVEKTRLSLNDFRRLRSAALRNLALTDRLSLILLVQIERY